ncbi:hypothetical protein [Rhodopila sp.]|jgi:hypothetical protein|nr:hypothetical protein [Rhodopila sp.]HVZ07558.1 hypothetical protein [Rhodopila sp.]
MNALAQVMSQLIPLAALAGAVALSVVAAQRAAPRRHPVRVRATRHRRR